MCVSISSVSTLQTHGSHKLTSFGSKLQGHRDPVGRNHVGIFNSNSNSNSNSKSNTHRNTNNNNNNSNSCFISDKNLCWHICAHGLHGYVGASSRVAPPGMIYIYIYTYICVYIYIYNYVYMCMY